MQVIISSLDDVKKHIPRCDEAFDKIRESVGLLKGNFGGYYKDYVASNNPTIIMENFVLDVSKKTESSPKVTGQFRRIISHYRKLASQQAQHPKLRTLFEQVDKNFSALEKESRVADEADTSSDEEVPGDETEKGEASDVLQVKKSTGARRVRRRRKRTKKRRKKKAVKSAAAGPETPETESPEVAKEGPTPPVEEAEPDTGDVPPEMDGGESPDTETLADPAVPLSSEDDGYVVLPAESHGAGPSANIPSVI